jgi:hypothetical protein
LVERSPEKAGVGGSIPSLATTFSTAYKHPQPQFYSISFQNSWLDLFASWSEGAFFEGVEMFQAGSLLVPPFPFHCCDPGAPPNSSLRFSQ